MLYLLLTSFLLLLNECDAQATAFGNLLAIIDIDEGPNTGVIFTVNVDQATLGTFSVNCPEIIPCSGTGLLSCDLTYNTSQEFDYETASVVNCNVTVDNITDILRINVNDIDDVGPSIPPPCPTTTFNVSEDTAGGDLLVSCIQNCSACTLIIYEMTVEPLSGTSKFVIDPNSGNVSVAANPGFDYESINIYTLKITSRTPLNAGTSITNLTINIIDVNEVPTITNLPQVVYIDEDYPYYGRSPSTKSIITITATDPDGDSLNGSVVSTNPAGSEHFYEFVPLTLDLQSVLDNATFDFENTALFPVEINVSISDGSLAAYGVVTVVLNNLPERPWFNTESNYSIDIIYPPECRSQFDRFYITEHIPLGHITGLSSDDENCATDGIYIADLTNPLEALQYFDPDYPSGHYPDNVNFEFQNSNFMNTYFSVTDDGSGKFYLTVTSDINYEDLCSLTSGSDSHNFEIEIFGVDASGLTTTNFVTVRMNIRNENEFTPQFSQTSYEMTLIENSAYNTILGTVICSEPQDCQPESVEYRSILTNFPSSNDGEYYFDYGVSRSITNGIISVHRPVDYETIQTIIFGVTCRDEEGTGVGGYRLGTATVTVNVVDVNDNEPKFTETFYSLETRYNAEERTPLVTVTATDADSGVNAKIIYTLIPPSNEFTIDADTGTLYTTGKTLLPYQNYEVYIFALDSGTPQQTSSNVVTVAVVPFITEQALVDLYLAADFNTFNSNDLLAVLDEVFPPKKFRIYQVTGGFTEPTISLEGVKVTIYALESNSSLYEANLGKEKVFIMADELLDLLQENALGFPAEVLTSPGFNAFPVVKVEKTQVAAEVDVEGESGDTFDWLTGTREGNIVLFVLVLISVLVTMAIAALVLYIGRAVSCWTPGLPSPPKFAPTQPDNKLNVGKPNKQSITNLAKYENTVSSTEKPPPPKPVITNSIRPRGTIPPPPVKTNETVPVAEANAVNPGFADTVRNTGGFGHRMWQTASSNVKQGDMTGF